MVRWLIETNGGTSMLKAIIVIAALIFSFPTLAIFGIILSLPFKDKPAEVETVAPCAHVPNRTLDQLLDDCKGL